MSDYDYFFEEDGEYCYPNSSFDILLNIRLHIFTNDLHPLKYTLTSFLLWKINKEILRS